MANEITVIAQLNVQNGALTRQFVGSGSADQATAAVAHLTRSLTATTQITDPGITSIGWVGIANLSTVGNVEFGNASGNTPFIVEPGTSVVFNANGQPLWAGSSSGTVNADFFLAEK